MRLVSVPAPEFDLATTLNSGQVFHWQASGGGFVGAIGDVAAYVEQRGDTLFANSQAAGLITHYFGLDHPLLEICASFPRDETMDAAREFCRGLRVIRQPKWECLATFICSSMKQVAHIRQMSQALRERFGKRCHEFERDVWTFPSAPVLARTTEEDLRGCGLGYRAKNLLKSAQLVASGEADLHEWSSLPDDALRARLCELPGVGAKVANCTMLFAYERLRAFPIDVWIERVLKARYFPRRRKFKPNQLRDFSSLYFGPYGGYAQQYLFHHARLTGRGEGGR